MCWWRSCFHWPRVRSCNPGTRKLELHRERDRCSREWTSVAERLRPQLRMLRKGERLGEGVDRVGCLQVSDTRRHRDCHRWCSSCRISAGDVEAEHLGKLHDDVAAECKGHLGGERPGRRIVPVPTCWSLEPNQGITLMVMTWCEVLQRQKKQKLIKHWQCSTYDETVTWSSEKSRSANELRT